MVLSSLTTNVLSKIEVLGKSCIDEKLFVKFISKDTWLVCSSAPPKAQARAIRNTFCNTLRCLSCSKLVSPTFFESALTSEQSVETLELTGVAIGSL